MVVANPIGLTFTEWATALISDNGIALGAPASEAVWQDWTASLNDQLNAALPNPYTGWSGWDEWAEVNLPVLEALEAVAPVATGFANTIGASTILSMAAGLGVGGPQGVLSIWVYLVGAVGATVFRQGVNINNRFNTTWSGTQFVIALSQPAGVNQWSAFVTPAVSPLGQWTHFLVSYDVNFAAGARIVQLAIDGTLVPMVPFIDIGAAMSITGLLDVLVGGGAAYGCVGQVWYGQGQFLDLTVPGNIELFVGPGPTALDLGPVGENPTGVSPTIYLNDAGALFLNNLGTAGGVFTGGAGTCTSGAPS